MIVKSCHVEGFGNLIDEKFDFKDGLNVYTETNGWGKSTLAAFIKSMFYGMELSHRKKLTEYKRYEPWSGSIYGGSVTFEVKGRQYRAVRRFGKKDGLFELYDALTNLPSSDYSEKLGDELFGIDRESFERSIYIKLDTEQREPELSDSICAKLNDLVENTDDINNFEAAYKRLDALASSIVPKRGKGGEACAIEKELSELKGELLHCASAEREAQQLRDRLARARRRRVDLKKRLSDIDSDIDALEIAARKKRYERLAAAEDTQKKRLAELKEFFANGLPCQSEIEKRLKDAKELEIFAAQMAELSDADKKRTDLELAKSFFNGMPPTSDDIDACRENIISYNLARERLAKYEPTDEELQTLRDIHARCGGLPSAAMVDEKISEYEKISKLSSRISELREKQRIAQERDAETSDLKSAFIGIAAAAAFLTASVLTEPAAAKAAFAAMFLASLAIAVIIRRRSKESPDDTGISEIEALSRERGQLLKSCLDWIREVFPDSDIGDPSEAIRRIREYGAEAKRIENKLTRYEEESKHGDAEKLRRGIEDFLGKYPSENSEKDFSRRLAAVQAQLGLLTRLSDEFAAYDRARGSYESIASSLDGFLSAYNAKGSSKFEKVQYIRDMLMEYRDTSAKYDAAKQELDEFEENNNTSAFSRTVTPNRSLQELEYERSSAAAELDDLLSFCAKAEHMLEKQEAIADRRAEIESAAADKQERLDMLRKKHYILKQTMLLLTRAKEDIDSRYMSDMISAFNGYMSMIAPDQDMVALTPGLDTKVIVNGRALDSGHLSRGCADLTNICTRLALAKVMYKNEVPFIILDDPFTNLDDEKASLALGFLQELAKEKQIFYFTCHSSRST